MVHRCRGCAEQAVKKCRNVGAEVQQMSGGVAEVHVQGAEVVQRCCEQGHDEEQLCSPCPSCARSDDSTETRLQCAEVEDGEEEGHGFVPCLTTMMVVIMNHDDGEECW